MDAFFSCASARRVNFKKGGFIIEANEPAREFGILLEGTAQSIKWDASGKQVIITIVEAGGTIGVLRAASPNRVSPLAVQAATDVCVLLFPFEKLIGGCEKKCPQHNKLLHEYISAVADKGLELHERINCLLESTVRKKIITYLTKIANEQASAEIILPINRNIMAEYLNVERSALSRELSQMKNDGLIEYRKNKFRLLDTMP